MADKSDGEVERLRARVAALEATRTAANPGTGCVLIVALLVMVGVGFGLIRSCHSEPETPKTAAEIEADQDALLSFSAQAGVQKSLKDPASAKFGTVTVSHKAGRPIVCGYVNAKNGFGGYTGMQPFMADGPDLVMAGSRPGRAFVRRWNSACKV